MQTIIEFDHTKATQCINFFAEQEGGNINKMKAIKLIWLADRLHLRKYGRPIVNDAYWAMEYGPVGSSVKDITQLSTLLPTEERKYATKYLKKQSKYRIISKKNPDYEIFSNSEIEILKKVYEKFKDYNAFELAEFSHKFHEWKKHEKELKTTTRVVMNYKDFFAANPKNSKEPIKITTEELEASKENFEINCVIAEFWK